MNIFLKKLLIIANFLIITALICIPVNAEKQTDSNKIGSEKIDLSSFGESEKIEIGDQPFFEDEEEKVVISIINFGRKNPFKPYIPSKNVASKKEVINFDDIPLPPTFEEHTELSEQVRELMSSRVNGILYDPSARSIAIVDIKGNEYMVHVGDVVQGIMVDKIAENSVTLKYGSNTYSVAVGEVIEGAIQTDPVQRQQRTFAGSDYDLPDLNAEELNK